MWNGVLQQFIIGLAVGWCAQCWVLMCGGALAFPQLWSADGLIQNLWSLWVLLFIMNSETAFHNSVPAGSIFLWSCFFELLGISTDSLICAPQDWGHCFFAAKFHRQLWGCRHVDATRCWCIWIEGFDYLHSFTGDARAVCPAGKTEWIWNCNLHMSCIPCNTLCTCFPQPYSWSVYR